MKRIVRVGHNIRSIQTQELSDKNGRQWEGLHGWGF
jgi:hypothetical protein